MIDFEKIEETKVDNLYGGNGTIICKMYTDENVKIMKAIINKGCSIGLHKHTDSFEAVYVISGTATCTIDGKEEVVKEGQCHYCPKGSEHKVINNFSEPLVTFSVIHKLK